MDSLKLKSRILPPDQKPAIAGRRPMWRRVVDQQTGEILAVIDPPNWPRQQGVTPILDPDREYYLKILGVTDPFEDTHDFGNGPVTSTKFIFEFQVTNSAKWNGVVLMSYYRIPVDWEDPKAELPELAFALEGHRLGDDEDFDIRKHLLAETRFKAWIKTGESKAKKKQFNQIERHYPVQTLNADDFVPDENVAPVKPPVSASTPAGYDADGVPDDFQPDEIPF